MNHFVADFEVVFANQLLLLSINPLQVLIHNIFNNNNFNNNNNNKFAFKCFHTLIQSSRKMFAVTMKSSCKSSEFKTMKFEEKMIVLPYSWRTSKWRDIIYGNAEHIISNPQLGGFLSVHNSVFTPFSSSKTSRAVFLNLFCLVVGTLALQYHNLTSPLDAKISMKIYESGGA